MRCTGCATSIAVTLLEHLNANNSSRIIILSSGPCTEGPAKIVSQRKAEPIRSHLDLQKDMSNAKYSSAAVEFYKRLASRCASIGIAVDVFSNSLDQTGLYEMRCLIERTDSSVSETEIGESGTNEWWTGVLDPNMSIAFYFEVTNPGGDQEDNASMSQNHHQYNTNTGSLQAAYLQFQTLYNHPSGRKRLRVTTVARAFADRFLEEIGGGFDQEAAAVLMARFTMFQMESTGSFDVVRRIDRLLVRLISKFASYNKNDPSSFQLAEEFTLFPQFIFYLRRSHFLETFNCSPDETAFYRTSMLRENVLNSLVMIQPALMEYSFDSPGPVPVLLDSISLKRDVILLLDTYFHCVIWRGEKIQTWYDLEYHKLPEYENFRNLLKRPAEDAKEILKERLPVPKFVQTYANGSQARFLLSRVNPSRTHCNDPSYGGSSERVILTEDVSLKDFMEVLIRYAVEG